MKIQFNTSGKVILLFLAIMFCTEINCQILKDTTTLRLVKTGIEDIYGSKFREAESILQVIEKKFPGHPATDLYSAIMTYYRYYPLIPSGPGFKNFELNIQECINKCEEDKNWMDDPEMVLINVAARGLLMLCYSSNDMNSEILPMTISTYKCIRKSFDYKHGFPDFFYFTGMYNYYREAYPEQHPFFKPIAALFPKGNKLAGLKDLNYSAENSVMLRAESFSLLSWINIYYENDYTTALAYGKSLLNDYPSNLLFRAEYIKALLLLKNYSEAEKVIDESGSYSLQFFHGQLCAFNGLIQEKKYRNYNLAENNYNQSIKYLESYGPRSRDYVQFAKDGIRRVNEIKSGRLSSKSLQAIIESEPVFPVF